MSSGDILGQFNESHLIDAHDNDDSKLECTICSNFMVDVFEHNACGFQLCESCRSRLSECPNCRKPLLPTDTFFSLNASRKMREARVRCCVVALYCQIHTCGCGDAHGNVPWQATTATVAEATEEEEDGDNYDKVRINPISLATAPNRLQMGVW